MGEIYTPIPHFHFCVGTYNFFPPDGILFSSGERNIIILNLFDKPTPQDKQTCRQSA